MPTGTSTSSSGRPRISASARCAPPMARAWPEALPGRRRHLEALSVGSRQSAPTSKSCAISNLNKSR